MNLRRETVISWLALGVVSVSLAFFLFTLPFGQHAAAGSSFWQDFEVLAFAAIVVLLVVGNLVYQVARLGYLLRCQSHHGPSREALARIYDTPAPRLGILIPSYKEEAHVLLQTILSAALMDYPSRRIAVLLDDPPNSTGDDLIALNQARSLVKELNETFDARSGFLQGEHRAFMDRARASRLDLGAESIRLAQSYEQIALWLDEWAHRITNSSSPASAHTDRWFIEKILREPARAHRAHARQLRSTLYSESKLAHEYRRLVSLVTVEIESFERKLYANLSHQPNKAMNLNSYIGLIGRNYEQVSHNDGLHLVECDNGTLKAPPVEYVLTIDADSIVLPDYALRLVKIMEDDPGLAVAQTPYSAYPGAPGALERVAGATTDIQYIIHQGFTRFNATYWVGANALLRLAALHDICTFVQERGHRVPIFIQDRTVIEDTGATIDLIRRGWRLHNHPERLAYSATPPDFGSLIIQRRRWSNGGLIILPDLMRHACTNAQFVRTPAEMLMRVHYLISPATGNLGLLILLLCRFDDSLASPWLPLTALPYYFIYARDLRLAGYRWADVFRVYALNLLLIPVNLAGVFRSLQQAITGKKAAFGRTPKVQARTAMPPLHVLLQGLLVTYLAQAFVGDMLHAHYSHAAFALINCAFCLYGITRFIGWRAGYDDLCAALANRYPIKPAHPYSPVRAYAVNRPWPSTESGDRVTEARRQHGRIG